MRVRGPEAPALRVLLTMTLLVAWGCSGPPPPVSPPEAVEVHCQVCGTLVARGATKAVITPEGIDVFTCKKCIARPVRRKA